METRNIYIIALVIASVSSGYYYFSGKGKKLDSDSTSQMSFSANDVKLTQSDVKGMVSVRASVAQAQQDPNTDITQLYDLKATTYIAGKEDTIYTAPKATGYNDNEKFVLQDNVVAQKTTPQGDMIFHTTELTGYPDTKTIQTDRTIQVDSPQGRFTSQGLKADLNSGQYEFFNIRGKYAP
ncbi:LPS export ABC transporter periplasmic protein LptC [Acinetobacter rathckeae]|uniref:LPS export ABC transporter periplasmic protein LptC n=1 Tax=Acinetobacter rathckeae TaxID=2605272 RepID=UPI0018A262D0|nr:LPS export ABC transporter periplasmic protein LptC [Acinetobacter rathckeae]MBF7687130.1 LPS export ABC transporter periplasmic protein LptC [Acinetobacter rathckeae]MBF7694518.1 LPS export ABC transporter periplasmic protein LptC [Acinetobacter rathckeae]